MAGMAGSTERTDLLSALHPVTRALRRIEEEAAAQEGLTMWRYAILSVVAGASQREIAAYLQYSPNRLVVDLRELERRGWVTRRPGPDRRANVLGLTEPGEAVRRRVRAEIHRREDALLDGLSAAQRDCFGRAVRDLADLVRYRTTAPTPPSS
jgi:DNA-binding MarR family transcriptional regulator